MTRPTTKLYAVKGSLAFALSLVFAAGFAISLAAPAQDDEGSGSRHICPSKAIRKDGTCDPNPNGTSPKASAAQKKPARYTRVAKQSSTAAKCHVRVEETGLGKPQVGCDLQILRLKKDLPETSPRVGVTIWRVREAQRDYDGARILSHPGHQAERLEGHPVLSYGERVRLGIESPNDGYLYVFDRELYHDGSLSAPYMVFPSTKLRRGDYRIWANRLIELPAATDAPFYFEAKKVGLDPSKRLVAEILSIVITDKPIEDLRPGEGETLVSTKKMDSIENLYAGRAEVFELDYGVGRAYSTIERDAASNDASRMLTHRDPVPQTFFLVEDKHNKGLLVTIALTYRNFESVSRVANLRVRRRPDPRRRRLQ